MSGETLNVGVLPELLFGLMNGGGGWGDEGKGFPDVVVVGREGGMTSASGHEMGVPINMLCSPSPLPH